MRDPVPDKLWRLLVGVHQDLVTLSFSQPLTPQEKALLERLEKFLDAAERDEKEEEVSTR